MISTTWQGNNSDQWKCIGSRLVYLGNCFKHRNEDKFDETNLCCRFCHFVSVHEGCHWKSFVLLTVRLEKKQANINIIAQKLKVILSDVGNGLKFKLGTETQVSHLEFEYVGGMTPQ